VGKGVSNRREQLGAVLGGVLLTLALEPSEETGVNEGNAGFTALSRRMGVMAFHAEVGTEK